MQTSVVQNQIRELESIKRQTRYLRLGATLGSLLFTLICVAAMNNAIRSLFQPGPNQDRFVQQVSTGLGKDVAPQMQQLAVQTITDSRPIVEDQFTKLNAQVPRVAQASMTEFNTLQKELPASAEKVLDETFDKMIKGREAKLRAMFPDASDEKIEALMNNLTEESNTHLTTINHQLFDPHISTMQSISTNMDKIEQQESPHLKGEIPTWQMGLLLFDIARADVKGLELPESSPKSGAAKPAAKPAAPVSKGY